MANPGEEFAERCRKAGISPLPTLGQERMNLCSAAHVFARRRKAMPMYWAGDGAGEDAPRVFWFTYPGDMYALRMDNPHSIGLTAQRDVEADEHLRQVRPRVSADCKTTFKVVEAHYATRWEILCDYVKRAWYWTTEALYGPSD